MSSFSVGGGDAFGEHETGVWFARTAGIATTQNPRRRASNSGTILPMNRLFLLIGLIGIFGGCAMTASSADKSYSWKQLWDGNGPPSSPTGEPPSLYIVHSLNAWMRLITPYVPHDTLTQIMKAVDWSKETVLLLQSVDNGPEIKVKVESITGNAQKLTVKASLKAPPPDTRTYNIEVRPWAVLTVSSDLFTSNPEVQYTLDGMKMAVKHER